MSGINSHFASGKFLPFYLLDFFFFFSLDSLISQNLLEPPTHAEGNPSPNTDLDYK